MSSIPAVSVIMSVYNEQRYVAEAVESILRQSYRNFEFIIVDDGSSDDTPKILSRYAGLDERIRIVTHPNRGLAASLNVGIALARGEWVARMDADDISLKDRLESQLAWLEKTQSDVCGGWTKIIGHKTWRVRRYASDEDLVRLTLCFRTPFAHPAVIMRSSLVRTIGYNEQIVRGQDYELWTRLALAGARMTNVPRVVLKYRIHSMQTAQLNRSENMRNRDAVQKRFVESVIDWPGASEIIKKFSLASDTPSIEDAGILGDILMSVTWASAKAKLMCYLAALRYVRPQSIGVYGLYEAMRKKLAYPRNISSLLLLVQSLCSLSPDTRLYGFIKRFVR